MLARSVNDFAPTHGRAYDLANLGGRAKSILLP
jgi:hypothetical protein